MFNIRIVIFSLIFSLGAVVPAHAQPLQVCATVPELGNLAREIGGEQVAVTVFAKGTEDPHFVVPKPSFVTALSRCDAYVQIGLELEAGWAPPLLLSSRNARVQTGRPGHIDASVVIAPLEIPATPVNRSQGDVHPSGNPHYLMNPMNGLHVAGLLRDRLSALRPSAGQDFARRYQDFRRRLGLALVGEALFNKYDFEKLALLAERGRLAEFLSSQGEEALLTGWLGMMQPYSGANVVGDHNAWPYFASLFGLNIIAYLEPLPGIPPTTGHMQTVIELIQANQVKAILSVAYYNPRYAEFVAGNTAATVVNMADQVASRPGTDTYLAMLEYNVKHLSAVLGGTT